MANINTRFVHKPDLFVSYKTCTVLFRRQAEQVNSIFLWKQNRTKNKQTNKQKPRTKTKTKQNKTKQNKTKQKQKQKQKTHRIHHI